MSMEITFPGGLAVTARYKGFTIETDQPVAEGGAGSAPTPFDLFLSALGTCAGLYALRFCQQRGIDTDGLFLKLETEREGGAGRISTIRLVVGLPDGFPEKYRDAILRAVDHCAVKRHILEPPGFELIAEAAQSQRDGSQIYSRIAQSSQPVSSSHAGKKSQGPAFTTSEV